MSYLYLWFGFDDSLFHPDRDTLITLLIHNTNNNYFNLLMVNATRQNSLTLDLL